MAVIVAAGFLVRDVCGHKGCDEKPYKVLVMCDPKNKEIQVHFLCEAHYVHYESLLTQSTAKG